MFSNCNVQIFKRNSVWDEVVNTHRKLQIALAEMCKLFVEIKPQTSSLKEILPSTCQ